MPVYEFYGIFNGQVAKKVFLTGDEVKEIIILPNNNRPREVKRILSYSRRCGPRSPQTSADPPHETF